MPIWRLRSCRMCAAPCARIDYSDAEAPVLAVRLQEVFGLTRTPEVDDGRISLVMHLLSPAHRPVQVTTDLEGFWQTSYHDVRKDMRGRYPKHIWPENPLEAQPTARTTQRSSRQKYGHCGGKGAAAVILGPVHTTPEPADGGQFRVRQGERAEV